MMSLAVAQPIYSASPGPAVRSVTRLAYDVGKEGGAFWYENAWLVSNLMLARYTLCAWALSTGAERILMVDDDIVFTSYDVKALYAIDADVVSGCYTRRQPGEDAYLGCAREGGEMRGVLAEMSLVPLGMCLVKRDVLRDLITKHGVDLFAFGKGAEDCSSFSNRARESGYRLWLHRGVDLGHIGLHEFRIKGD